MDMPTNPMITMLIKSMGVDPEVIKSQIENAGANFTKIITHFNTRLDNLEQKLDVLINIPINPPTAPMADALMAVKDAGPDVANDAG